MKIPEKDEYWYASDGKLVKILKVILRLSNGRWIAQVETIPERKKRLLRDRINPNSTSFSQITQKRNLIKNQETDSRKILRAYLGIRDGCIQ